MYKEQKFNTGETNSELRQLYNPECSELRMSQLRMLEILDYISDLCEKNGLRYWLCAGTLLGAYRHGGFIPWDDDLDIEMPIEDMLKLKKIIIESKKDGFSWQDSSTDKYYLYSYPKVKDMYSICYPTNKNQKEMTLWKYKGLWVDIFPLENHSLLFQKIGFYTNSYGRSYFNSSNIIINSLAHFRIKINNYIIFPFLRLVNKLWGSKKYYHKSLGCEYFYSQEIKNIFPLKKIEFEGKYYNAPFSIETHLKEFYGDNFMELPPQNKRSTHNMTVKFLK